MLDAYQEFWRVWLKANNPPNPDDPDLARVATGAELDTVRASIHASLETGTMTRLPTESRYHHRAAVLTVSAITATVTDCALDDAQIVVQRTGQVLNGEVATHAIAAELRHVDNRWRVLRLSITNRVANGPEPCEP